MSVSDEQPDSLWPELGIKPNELRPPISLVKEQASQLAPKTQGLVVAKVILGSMEGQKGEDVSYIFALVCPTLGNYMLELFTIHTQLISLYPVKIYSSFLGDRGVAAWKVTDENDLRTKLKEIFAHPKTVEAVRSMLAYSRAEGPKKARKNASVDEAPF